MRVTNSRPTTHRVEAIRRRRVCVSCAYRLSTIEVPIAFIEGAPPMQQADLSRVRAQLEEAIATISRLQDGVDA